MSNLKAYKVEKEIYQSSNSLVYKGIRTEDNKAVIIKVLNKENPTSNEEARFKYEYELMKSLDGLGTVKCYEYINEQEKLAYVHRRP